MLCFFLIERVCKVILQIAKHYNLGPLFAYRYFRALIR